MSEVKPLVAIHCLVYNHAPYLRDCLDGFVMQQTNFPFVAVVHDDASTDNSAAIIREYEQKYPHIFKPIYEIESIYKKGGFGAIDNVMLHAINATNAKYVAMCEGDDYWTDPLKLQKQVDFMEANPEYVLCCHRYKIYNQNDGTWDKDYVHQLFEISPNGFSFSNQENFKVWITKTLTLLIRQDALRKMPSKKGFKYWRDVHMNYYLLKQGKGFCMPMEGSVYRRHQGGIFSALLQTQQRRIGMKIWYELLKYNQDDEILVTFYKNQHNNYRDYIRSRIHNRETKDLVVDIRTLLWLDYHFKGITEVMFSIKKMMLSMKYTIKSIIVMK
jgi:glycosyltransferase involved in cell wall biosynthesis